MLVIFLIVFIYPDRDSAFFMAEIPTGGGEGFLYIGVYGDFCLVTVRVISLDLECHTVKRDGAVHQVVDPYAVLCEHNGIVMGYSAGALIQLSEYHLSPDHDYPVFAYYNGLPYLGGFCLEVHYEGRDVQKEAIERVIKERGMPVYATSLMKGAIVVDNGKIQALGDVFVFGDGGKE